MIEKIDNKYKTCNKCTLCKCDHKIYGHGNINADIMVIGEGPGREDFDTSVPFSGPAGKLLYNILEAIDIKHEDLYFTNIILCKTNEKYRSPSWDEIKNCAERLDEEINEIKPNVILTIGGLSLRRFMGQNSKVTEIHGQWFMDFKPPYARYFSFFNTSWALNASTEGEMKAKKRVLWNDAKVFRDELIVTNFNLVRN